MNIIGKVRKSAFERSVEGLIKSVEINYSMDSFLVPREYFYEKGTLTLLTVEGKAREEKIGTHGKIEGNGFIHVNQDGTIHIENLCDKSYCANGEVKKIEITPNPDGKIPELDEDYPVITLNGEQTVYVEIGGVYQEKGATAKTIGGKELEYTKEIKYNNEVVEKIETTSEREYTIIYSAENEGKKATITRTVIVADMTPEITMTEENESYVKEQEVLIRVSGIRPNIVSGFTYQIDDGEKIEVKGISKIVILKETGIHTVKVSAIDNHGHKNEVSKTYKIDSIEPVLTFSDVTIKVDEVVGYDLMTGVTARDNSGIEPKISYTGSLSATVGIQEVIYKAEDEAGNVSTKTRTFRVVEAEGAIISFSPIQTNGWVKSVNVTISATVKIGETLSAFTYRINNGVAQNGTINNNNGTASVTLNSTGTYIVEATATGEYNNTKIERSGTYQIDATVPNIGEIGGNTDSWTTSKTITATITDENSKVVAYGWTTTNTVPTSWTEITETTSYHFSKSITANGTYYLWGKDGAGNISTVKTVTVNKIDTTVPSITSSYTSTGYSMTEKTSVEVSTLYKATFGGMGGDVACKNGSTPITDLKDLGVGTHTLTCVATGANGKTASVSPKVVVKSAGISGSELATKENLPELSGMKRYRGANPNNWVCFGNSSITSPGSCDENHKWRIIGVDSEGRMKIMTNYSYYDEQVVWGANSNWEEADLKTELNGRYFYGNREYIDVTHRGYIVSATWYTGSNTGGTTLQSFVNGERSNSTTGRVGLINVVDFGYAGINCTLSTNMYVQGGNECMYNNWIELNEWTITPYDGSNIWYPSSMMGGATMYYTSSSNALNARPAVYLNNQVGIIGGTGTENSPYIISK